MRSSGKSKSSSERDFDDASAGRVGARRVHVKRGNDDEPLGIPAGRAQREHGGHKNALIQPVGQEQLNRRRRRGAPAVACDSRVVVRVLGESDAASATGRASITAGEQPAVFSFKCRRKPAGRRGDALVFVAHRVPPRRVRPRRAPSQPDRRPTRRVRQPFGLRQRHDGRADGRRPARVTCWIVATRTKSAALRPPRARAAPLVGSTWFDPVA